jgi:hypothetical protein
MESRSDPDSTLTRAFSSHASSGIEKTTDEAALKSFYYNEAAAAFRSEAAKVRRDFDNRAEFNRLDDALSRISPDELDEDGKKTRREILADASRPLIRFGQET